MPSLFAMGFGGLCLILALTHHGSAALVVGGLLLALLVLAPFIDTLISPDRIARRPPPKRPPPRRPPPKRRS